MLTAKKIKLTVASGLKLGLETHISLPLFALALLALIWSATYHLIGVEQVRSRDLGMSSNQELLDTYEAQLVRNLASIDLTLKAVRYAVELKGEEEALPFLKKQELLPSGLVFAVSIADRTGQVVARNPAAGPGSPAPSVAAESYFKFHQQDDTDTSYVSRVMVDSTSLDGFLHFSRRLNDSAGHFKGIVIVQVDPAYFTSGYERARLGEHGVLGLFSNGGVFRALRSGDTVSWGQNLILPASLALIGAPMVSSWDGVPRYISVRRLPGFPLSALVGQAQKEQMAPFEQYRRSTIWQAAIASLVLVLAVTLVCLWSWQLAKSRRHKRRAQETYAAVSEASGDAFFVLRSVLGAGGLVSDFLIDATNGGAEKMTGLDQLSLNSRTLRSLLPEWWENGIFTTLVGVAQAGGMQEQEWENRASGLRSKWLHRQVVAVEGGIVIILRDISEGKQAQQRILHMANHDALTGLPNRSLIDDRLAQAILHAQRNSRMVSVVFIDLDSFKLVNDSLGHSAGDELLKIVATRMQTCVRRNDTVGRFGGDEFVIILSDQQETDGAVALLDKIRDAVNEPMTLAGQELHVTCSMGVVRYPQGGLDADTLLMNADAALYYAKELGRNNCQFYRPELTAKAEEKMVLLEGLKSALEYGQFRLLYQPKVDLRSGLVFGVEALIRWQHPEYGMISPLSFISLAEDSGLIVSIGEWVLETACSQGKAWQDQGLAPLTISVNVSPRQFEEKHLVERVALALQKTGLGAQYLELEATESLIMRDFQQSVEKMRQLKAMGISLSIDDFGTGHSSLWRLKSFPVDRLKIDKSFIDHLAENLADQAIATAVISLGHKLNLRVIAEGVETEQQRNFLKANECDEIQGYFFSGPVTAAEIEAMLVQQQTSMA